MDERVLLQEYSTILLPRMQENILILFFGLYQ
jgi:hypothetical protein